MSSFKNVRAYGPKCKTTNWNRFAAPKKKGTSYEYDNNVREVVAKIVVALHRLEEGDEIVVRIDRLYHAKHVIREVEATQIPVHVLREKDASGLYRVHITVLNREE